MTQKPTSPDRTALSGVPIRVTLVTLDGHMSSAVDRARLQLREELPGLELSVHAVAEWGADGSAAEACRRDIETADIVVANMIFLEEHALKLAPWLEARREHCDCMVGAMSAAEVVKKTRLGDFNMAKPTGGAIGLLKRLRGKSKNGVSAGRGQMKLLRQLPKVLKYIPGKAQDVRAYFMTLQYLLAGSDENIANMIRFLVGRYASGEREVLRNAVKGIDPKHYPDVGVYHPRLKDRVADDLSAMKGVLPATGGTVGLLLMRSYILADNTAHYDGVIAALEAKGLRVVPAFASGLDARPAIDAYFMKDGKATVDAVVSLTGFSLVGGPAYNDSAAAEEALAALDVPYLSAFSVEFQTIEEWDAGDHGLTPVETTMMVSLPEIDGATGPILFGGRSRESAGQDMVCHTERAGMLAARVAKLIALRRRPKAERKVATVIYNFPPNGGAIGTAAHLSVFRSLWNTLRAMKDEGYTVDLPESVDALRDALLKGNSALHGMDANVAATIPADTHVAREARLEELEAQWGPAPGRHQSDGSNIFVLGAQFGNVFIGVQPAFGYEGDPMRLLFEKGFTPTHAFCAFYSWLREEYAADAILHFGTHGALEFMPGKQAGMSATCWPDYLIGDMPNLYLYACNNPSEGTIARRRSGATLVSYLTPPVGHAGLYKGLLDLKTSIDRWRGLPPEASEEAGQMAAAIHDMAAAIDLIEEGTVWDGDARAEITALADTVREYEMSLIPHGLHVVGEAPSDEERRDFIGSANEALGENRLGEEALDAIARGDVPKGDAAARLAMLDTGLRENAEIEALLTALDGRYIRPVSGGDIVRSPEIVPTGRNIHAFDPFRMPSPFAIEDGKRQAQRLIDRYIKDHGIPPKSVALVLWGTDTMKTEGAPIAQALALIGARPRFDGFGRLAGADLIPLEELGRPRIDVTMTLSGIFRDLLPLHTKLLAEASLLAAKADEALDQNAIRAHALAYAEERKCDFETAALRVFSNAAGAYGSNVNMLIDCGAWEEGDEIADTYTSRKCFAYGVDGQPQKQSELLSTILRDVDASFQNIDSVEVSITSVDHYFDTLGGISRAVKQAGGKDVPVYVGDQTSGTGKVRALSEQVALETRTRTLNPKWYEALLDHGYEGVRQIESHVTNTFGWSATTGQVDPWVYKNLTESFVLDEAMRRRLADLNPKASAKLANRLIEAGERNYWTPDEETWAALRAAGDELEDRVEGIIVEHAA